MDKSWFVSVEIKQEYEHSYSQFLEYYGIHKSMLGTNYTKHIDTLLSRLQVFLPSFVYYEFMYVTHFGFKGDNFVESCNSTIEQGPFSVSTAMKLDKSVMIQARKVEYQSNKRDSGNAHFFSRSILWSC